MKRLLPILVRLLPAAFRRRFGAEIVEQVTRDHATARMRGRWTALRFGVVTTLDLLGTALAERWRPTLGRAQRPTRPRTVVSLADVWVDFVEAQRGLRRAPGFTALAVGTLGLALGALAAIFTVVEAVVLRELPYEDPERIVFIVSSAPGSEMTGELGASPEMYLQYKDAPLLEGVAFQGYGGTRTLRVGDRAERIPMWFPSVNLFQTLGVTPLLGRLPLPEDDGKVALLGHRLWTTTFGADPAVIGSTIEADGATRTVIGVMKPDFYWITHGFQLWLPYEITPQMIDEPGRFDLRLVARMRAGTTPDAVAGELTELARRLPERFGGSPAYARIIERHRAVVRPIAENLPARNAGVLWTLLGSAAIVLLIACANVANLFLVRVERRRHDHAVRRALGGSRARLIRVALAEALVVGLLAGVIAMLVVQIRLPVFVSAAAAFDRIVTVDLASTALFALAGALFAALACGLVPALRASSRNLAGLREAVRGGSRRRHVSQNGLVVAQTALALVLLIGSALLARSVRALHGVELGYETRDRMTFQFAPERADLVNGAAFARFHMDFMERIAALPDVESVGAVNNVPLDEPATPLVFFREEDAQTPDGGVPLEYTTAGGDYFATMGIPLLAGRAFSRAENTVNPGSVVISRTAAERLWPGRGAVGRRLRRADGEEWHTVVGVVGDVAQGGLGDAPSPLVYFPFVGTTPTRWRVTSPGYVVKTTRADVIAPEIRELIREVAPGSPMYQISTIEALAARELAGLQLMMSLLGVGALLALLFSAIGLFGVLSYLVAERTREIGVRVALGAETGQVRRMVVAQGSRVVAIGVALGLAVAALSTRALGALLFGVEPVDPVSFAGMSALMLLIGALASYLPARRASRVNPLDALREG